MKRIAVSQVAGWPQLINDEGIHRSVDTRLEESARLERALDSLQELAARTERARLDAAEARSLYRAPLSPWKQNPRTRVLIQKPHNQYRRRVEPERKCLSRRSSAEGTFTRLWKGTSPSVQRCLAVRHLWKQCRGRRRSKRGWRGEASGLTW